MKTKTKNEIRKIFGAEVILWSMLIISLLVILTIILVYWNEQWIIFMFIVGLVTLILYAYLLGLIKTWKQK